MTASEVAPAASGTAHRLLRWLGTAALSALLVLAAPQAGASWLDGEGRPNASARDALQLLADASADGLDPQDYRAAELAAQASMLTAAAHAAFERDLDAAMLRYLHDLHLGRVDPRTLGFRLGRPSGPAPDFRALLEAGVAAQRVPHMAHELRPKIGMYARLREALARYRALAADASLGALPLAAPVKPGNSLTHATALHQLLRTLGDLADDAPPPTDLYDETLVDGIRRFQTRHGLAADGVIGRATLAALNVPLPRRVQQLELALERLRWVPGVENQAFVAINIPMFRLWAWDSATPAEVLDMAVVVGRALNTQTPVLSQEMRYLIFHPYWNVPRSILLGETLPALASDAHYLERNDMEIVRGAGDDAEPVAATSENLALLQQGLLRVRQRPGQKNALGQVKFIFPNDSNVYLHGTPATQLFERTRRDFSHGCVRVENPAALARWVLRDQPDWTPERIAAAMAEGSPGDVQPQRVDLSRPVSVILFYITAMTLGPQQVLHFSDDIYGHDARLARALARR